MYQDSNSSEKSGTHLDNKIFPSAGGYDVESFTLPSRKRTLRSSNLPEATSEFHLPRVPSLIRDGSFHGTSRQGDTQASVTDEHLISELPTFHCRVGVSDAGLNGNVNFPVDGIGSRVLPLNLAIQSSEHEGNPQINVPSGVTVEVPNSTKEECPYTQAQTHKGLSFTESSVQDTGKPPISPRLDDVVNSLTQNDDISVKLPLDTHNWSSQQRFSQPNNSANDFLGRACAPAATNPKNSSEVTHSDLYSNNEEVSNQPSGLECRATLAYLEGKEKQCSIHDKVQHQSGDLGKSNCRLGEPESADQELRRHYSAGKALSNPRNVPATSDGLYCSSGLPHKFDENKLPCKKSASAGSEKLWDGSIQLNSSVTLSAVAFFRRSLRFPFRYWLLVRQIRGLFDL